MTAASTPEIIMAILNRLPIFDPCRDMSSPSRFLSPLLVGGPQSCPVLTPDRALADQSGHFGTRNLEVAIGSRQDFERDGRLRACVCRCASSRDVLCHRRASLP